MRRSFDNLAWCYQQLEALLLGRLLARSRNWGLNAIDTPERILCLGDGDGRFSSALAARFPRCHIDVVESSPAMVRIAQQRASVHAGIRWFQQDARTFQPGRSYDVIVTQYFLDCFGEDDVQDLVKRFSAHLAPEGCWLWTDFRTEGEALAGLPRRVLVWLLYRFFRVTAGIEATKLVNPTAYFLNCGLSKERSRVLGRGLIACELWRLVGCTEQRPPA